MKIYEEHITEDHKLKMREREIEPNTWIDVVPYAIQMGVFIQDYDDKVEFGWVGSYSKRNKDGTYPYKLEGGLGARPIKYWMKIQYPTEDLNGWHSEFAQDIEVRPKKNHIYLCCIEIREFSRRRYELRLVYYNPTKSGEWHGFDYKDCTREVIAWREIPKPKKGGDAR